MAITLFENRNQGGASRTIRQDVANLGNRVDRPSSVIMDAADDEVLLFKNDNWRGGVLYLQGRNTINNLGSGAQGGRNSFGNSIRSVRITPFSVDLNITVVQNDAGELPGRWSTQDGAQRDIRGMIRQINNFLDEQQALLEVKEARITFRTDERRFSLRRNQSVPREWREQREIDVIIVDRFEREDLLGVAAFPHGGQTVRIAGKINHTSGRDEDLPVSGMALVLMHELGHFLGLAHGTSNNDDDNLMFPTVDPTSETLADHHLRPAQVREMHQRLARNVTRRRNRDD